MPGSLRVLGYDIQTSEPLPASHVPHPVATAAILDSGVKALSRERAAWATATPASLADSRTRWFHSIRFFDRVAGPAPRGDFDWAPLRSADPAFSIAEDQPPCNPPIKLACGGNKSRQAILPLLSAVNVMVELSHRCRTISGPLARGRCRRSAAASCPLHLPVPCALVSQRPWFSLSAIRPPVSGFRLSAFQLFVARPIEQRALGLLLAGRDFDQAPDAIGRRFFTCYRASLWGGRIPDRLRLKIDSGHLPGNQKPIQQGDPGKRPFYSPGWNPLREEGSEPPAP